MSVFAFSLQVFMLWQDSFSLKWAGGGPTSTPALPCLSPSFFMRNASSIHGAELSLIDLSVKARRHTQSTTMQFSLLVTSCPHPKIPKGARVTLRDICVCGDKDTSIHKQQHNTSATTLSIITDTTDE